MAKPPLLPDLYFHRTSWNLGDGSLTWSWQSNDAIYLSIPQIFWREAERFGWTPTWPANGYGFQYTSLEGFLGILRSGELWLSDYAYLNDIAELTHGASKVQEIFKEVGAKRPKSRAMLQAQSGPNFSKHRICVASFSMESDSLSQWRAYGPIAVGFDLTGGGFGYNNTALCRPVIYDPLAQESMLQLWANLNATAWEHETETEKRRLRPMYYDDTDRLLDLIAFFKNSGFADEREIRMVHTENSCISESFGRDPSPEKFRASGELIVPYLTTKDLTDSHPDQLPIVKVVVGPGPKAEYLVNGVKRALIAHGYDVPVSASGITYRK